VRESKAVQIGDAMFDDHHIDAAALNRLRPETVRAARSCRT
jgi:hypothetical protein